MNISGYNQYETKFQGCFPVMRFFNVRIRTEFSEHVNSFIDAY